jgi:hypothetical protein
VESFGGLLAYAITIGCLEGDPGRIVAVTLIDLHLEYRPGMTRVDTDDPSRGFKPTKISPSSYQ